MQRLIVESDLVSMVLYMQSVVLYSTKRSSICVKQDCKKTFSVFFAYLNVGGWFMSCSFEVPVQNMFILSLLASAMHKQKFGRNISLILIPN